MEKTRQYPVVIMGRGAPYHRLCAAGFAACLSVPLPGLAHNAADVFVAGAAVAVPSGENVTFVDVIEGADSALGPALRYRFVAPHVARTKTDAAFVQAEEDMAALCQDYVLPHLLEHAVDLPSQIIITLSDRKVEFGIADPDATQFFEAYRPEDGLCIWEGF